MVKHIVCWKLKQELTEREKATSSQKIREMLEALPGQIDGIVSMEVGRGFNGGQFDLCLYAEFTSREALAAYDVHPKHQKVREYVRTVVEDRAVIDYEV